MKKGGMPRSLPQNRLVVRCRSLYGSCWMDSHLQVLHTAEWGRRVSLPFDKWSYSPLMATCAICRGPAQLLLVPAEMVHSQPSPPPRTRCQHSGLSTLSVDGEGGRCDGPTDRDRCCVQEIDALVRDVVTDNPLPERVYAGWRDAAERSAATLDVGKKGAQYARGLKMWGEHPRGTSLSSPCLANAH